MADDEPVPMPDVVYHYTSIDTMMKIVQSQSIWATSVCYLNDTSEQMHFLNLVRQRLESIEFETEEDYKAANSFTTQQGINFEFRPFIASFSADGDSLPQWRSYCNAGNGVAIGFSTNCLKRADIAKETSHPPITRFNRVTYPAPTAYQEIDATFFTALSDAKEIIEGISYRDMTEGNSRSDTLSTFLNLLLQQEACFRKSHDFRSENEYRLVIDLLGTGYDVFKYRTSRSSLIPYVELTIPRLEEGHDSEPNRSDLFNPLTGAFQFIKHVVVGPSPNISLTLEAVKAFFKSGGIKADVVPSAVAFRDW